VVHGQESRLEGRVDGFRKIKIQRFVEAAGTVGWRMVVLCGTCLGEVRFDALRLFDNDALPSHAKPPHPRRTLSRRRAGFSCGLLTNGSTNTLPLHEIVVSSSSPHSIAINPIAFHQSNWSAKKGVRRANTVSSRIGTFLRVLLNPQSALNSTTHVIPVPGNI
jgi:hypothetical protein